MATQLTLTVIHGADLGKRHTFDQDRVTLGRDIHNDFVLTDGFASNWHGEFWRDANNIVYYDLRSRYGTLILIGDTNLNLHNLSTPCHARVVSGAEFQVGRSRLRLGVVVIGGPTSDTPRPTEEGPGSHYIMVEPRLLHDWVRHLPINDPGLSILLDLADQLNGLTTLHEVLDLTVRMTFDAFPAANFFAVSLLVDQDGQQNPELTEPY